MPSQFDSPRMKNLQEYFFARANKKIAEVKAGGLEIINLGMGNPDLTPPDEVTLTLCQESSNPLNHAYPSYIGLPEFRDAITNWYQENYRIQLDSSTQILPLNGSKQGIVYLTLSIVDKGDEVLIPNPGYSTYEKAAVIAGATPVFYDLLAEGGYKPDLQALAAKDLSKVKMMWISYPHNPTGATLTHEELAEIADFARSKNIVLVNDNPYSHITFGEYISPSLLELAREDDPFLELSSLSKTYNMPGWRIGWIAGNKQLISLVKNMFSNIETGQFIPLQKAAVVALQTPKKWVDDRNKVYADRKKVLENILEKLGCTIFPSNASLYVWAKLPIQGKIFEGFSEKFIFDLLEKTGIFLAPGTAFGSNGEGYVRAAICQPKEVLLKALSLL